jgi:hypothetical protein
MSTHNLHHAQRLRLVRAHHIARAENVYRVDFKPVNTPLARRLPIVIDAVGGVFVAVVLTLATLGLFYLPGAH